MAFLDNSGDIILDAVLTDTGRLRLAQGDGSFKISKFALGDDEINYGLYNKNHASGSAYFDLEILQMPVLEAFTNNSSQVKSRLMTMSRTNILYMPILKLNTVTDWGVVDKGAQEGTSGFFDRNPTGTYSNFTNHYIDVQSPSSAKFFVAVDEDTYDAIRYARVNASNDEAKVPWVRGLIQGYTPATSGKFAGQMIRVDQGLDTNQIAPTIGLDSDLKETAYIVEMDYRLGQIKKPVAKSTSITPVNFIDDDNIATYYLTTGYVDVSHPPANNTQTKIDAEKDNDPQVFDGPRGSKLEFRIHASAELQHSTYLFDQLGSTEVTNVDGNMFGFAAASADSAIDGKTTYYIDATARVVGANTGFRLDVPIRYIKIQ